MDPALWELTQADADEVAALVRLHPGADPPAELRLVTRFGDVATCRLAPGDILAARRHPSVKSLKAPRRVVPEPAAEPVTTMRRAALRRPPGPYSGRGAVIGVVDWGCDFTHPNFLRKGGGTRLLALWDQRGAGGVPPYGYGRVHRRADIDRALGSDDPFAALGYDPADADVDGSGSHGTHVLDIAAGRPRVGPGGVAPGADLVFVQLGSHARGPSGIGNSVTLLEAIDFVARVAGARPWVVNLSLGSHGGPHDGSTLVEQALDHVVASGPGRVIVQSCGNYFRRPIHASGRLATGERAEIEWLVDPSDRTANELEVWYPGRDRLGVEVHAPGGERVALAPLGSRGDIVVDGRRFGRFVHRGQDPNNGDNQVSLLVRPGRAGAWRVVLTAEVAERGDYHVWIERDEQTPGSQSRLRRGQAVASGTTNTICNGHRTITVGAYDPERDAPAAFSSAGPTRDGRAKPDLLAPGVGVLAARSEPDDDDLDDDALLTRKSGTSMATPHVTGAVAVLFQAAGRPVEASEIRQALLAGARPVRGPRAGHGRLDVPAAVRALATSAAASLGEDDPLATPKIDLRLARHKDTALAHLKVLVDAAKRLDTKALAEDLAELERVVVGKTLDRRTQRTVDGVRRTGKALGEVVTRVGLLADIQAGGITSGHAAMDVLATAAAHAAAAVKTRLAGALESAAKSLRAVKLAGARPFAAVADELRSDAHAFEAWRKPLAEPAKKAGKFVDDYRPGGTLDRRHGGNTAPTADLGPNPPPMVVVGLQLDKLWPLLGNRGKDKGRSDAAAVGRLLPATFIEKLGKDKVKITGADLTPAIRESFEKLVSDVFASRAAKPDVKPVVDALVANWPGLASHEPEKPIERLIAAMFLDDSRFTDQQIETSLVESLAKPGADELVKDVMAAAHDWPLGTVHFYKRLAYIYKERYKIDDPLAWYPTGFAQHNFFGQRIITINKICVPHLQAAETAYFAALQKSGLGSDHGFEVTSSTGAYSFRLKRANVMVDMLVAPTEAKGLFVHTIGRAIDVNYGTGRNPHVTTSPDVWRVVKSVLAWASTQVSAADEKARLMTLAGFDYGTWKSASAAFGHVLDASLGFKAWYQKWHDAFPASLLVPQTTWPKVEDYRRALAAAGRSKASPAVKAANAALASAREQARAISRKALAAHDKALAALTATVKTWNRLARQLPSSHPGLDKDLRAAARRVSEWKKRKHTPDAAALLALYQASYHADRARLQLHQRIDDIFAVQKLARPTGVPMQLGGGRHKLSYAELLDAMQQAVPDRTLWDTLDQADDAARAAEEDVDRQRQDPVLVDHRRGEVELAALTMHQRYARSHYRHWAVQGFADHPQLFVAAMQEAGWRWGAQYGHPDHHHFEYLKDLRP